MRNVISEGDETKYLDQNMRRIVSTIRRVKIARKSRRFTVRAYVDRITDGAVKAGADNVQQAAVHCDEFFGVVAKGKNVLCTFDTWMSQC